MVTTSPADTARIQALALLKAQCAADVYPTLSDYELATLLNATDAWNTWEPLTAYNHGDRVIPTVRNGHIYRAIVNQQYSQTPPGVSAATEPIWPIFSSPDSRVGITRPYWAGYDQQSGNYSLSMVTDGTVVWQDAGPDGVASFNLRDATYRAWLQKAGKASADYDVVVAAGSSLKRSTVYDHCIKMSCLFAPTGIF